MNVGLRYFFSVVVLFLCFSSMSGCVFLNLLISVVGELVRLLVRRFLRCRLAWFLEFLNRFALRLRLWWLLPVAMGFLVSLMVWIA